MMPMGPTDIDVVIPSFRLPEGLILMLYGLPKPAGCTVRFFVVADNPAITIPAKLTELATEADDFKLIVNAERMGFSATRNIGIDAGAAPYILFLDDDIEPSPELLVAYHNAILKHGDEIGFAGPVFMPPASNTVTQALTIMGMGTHFEKPAYASRVAWTPTANVLVARAALLGQRFDETLIHGGEDIAFLSYLSLHAGKMLLCVPEAHVRHPWWQGGKAQFGRLFRYGQAATDIICLKHIRPFTRIDFPNFAEWVLISLLLFPLAVIVNMPWLPIWLTACFAFSDWTTALILAITKNRPSPMVGCQIWLHQSAHQFGALWECLSTPGRRFAFMRRLDASFEKPFPSGFRLNRFKIIRGALFMLSALLVISICASQ